MIHALWLTALAVEVWAFVLARRSSQLLRGWFLFVILSSLGLMVVHAMHLGYVAWYWRVSIAHNLLISCLCMQLARFRNSWVPSSLVAVVSFALVMIGAPHQTWRMLAGTAVLNCLCMGALIVALYCRKSPLPTDGIAYAVCGLLGGQVICALMQTHFGLNPVTQAVWQVVWIAGILGLCFALKQKWA